MTAPLEISPIDTRWGQGFELLLRLAVIAARGRLEGIDVSELRRLSSYNPDMTLAEIETVASRDIVRGYALLACRNPVLGSAQIERLRAAVNVAAQSRHGVVRLIENRMHA